VVVMPMKRLPSSGSTTRPGSSSRSEANALSSGKVAKHTKKSTERGEGYKGAPNNSHPQP
jgi:hypothetical protein